MERASRAAVSKGDAGGDTSLVESEKTPAVKKKSWGDERAMTTTGP
ncbi:MAG: hypothetical protein U0326_17605 [Polyangiales bacterium]